MRDDETTHKNLEYIHKVLKNNGEWAQVAQALKFAVVEAHDVADYDAELAALEAKEASELAAKFKSNIAEANEALANGVVAEDKIVDLTKSLLELIEEYYYYGRA